MRRETARVETWAALTFGSQKLTLYGTVAGDVGFVLNRGAEEVVKGTELVIVLKRQTYNGMPYFILTAPFGLIV